jgi:tRNA 2-thiouridine synthesizing protein A
MKKMADKTLNALGRKCPMPVLMTKKELKKLSSGQTLELIVDDKGALKDVPALLHKTGDELLDTKEEGEQVTFTIKKA